MPSGRTDTVLTGLASGKSGATVAVVSEGATIGVLAAGATGDPASALARADAVGSGAEATGDGVDTTGAGVAAGLGACARKSTGCSSVETTLIGAEVAESFISSAAVSAPDRAVASLGAGTLFGPSAAAMNGGVFGRPGTPPCLKIAAPPRSANPIAARPAVLKYQECERLFADCSSIAVANGSPRSSGERSKSSGAPDRAIATTPGSGGGGGGIARPTEPCHAWSRPNST